MQAVDTNKSRRAELILRQIDSLPTLPSVAMRLLSLTADRETHARQVVELVNSDPALTSKVLALCRRADTAVRSDVVTIEQAVVLLGFSAIRNAVLSVNVVELFAPPTSTDAGTMHGEADPDGRPRGFDRVGFWQHCLAVAILAESLAAEQTTAQKVPADEAFVCGLLHDVGKLALDDILPKSLARVIELTDLNQGNIAEFERRVIGLDHHTAGKRLAEQWQLPHRLQDSIWLHGSPYEMLPKLAHRRLVGLVGLADLLVRQHHIGYSGNHVIKQDADQLAEALGLSPERIPVLLTRLYDELAQRSKLMGLQATPSRQMFMTSIQQANAALGRLNSTLERRSHKAAHQSLVLSAITSFHAAATPCRCVEDVLNGVAASASSALGAGFYALLYQMEDGNDAERAWLTCQYGHQFEPLRSELVEPPPHAPDLRALDARQPVALDLMGILPWVMDSLVDAPDLREVRLLPLACGWGTAAVLLHDRHELPPWEQLTALTGTWGAAVAAAGQHDGARRLGEDLAEANVALAEAQDKLLHVESMARLGEMAAGAAHEMNNPLAVISGRAQLLTTNLPPGTKLRRAAETIVEQADRLSDLITSLKLFADPPQPQRWPTDVGAMLQEVIGRIRGQLSEQEAVVLSSLQVQNSVLPEVHVDGDQVGQAVAELLLNALQSKPKTAVSIAARLDQERARLVITVTDDGLGMDGHTLSHAMDPFFSAKRAGRRVGLGLARARQYAVGHDGGIELRGSPDRGTVATLTIGLDPADAIADRGSGGSRGGWGGHSRTQLVAGAGGSSATSDSP